MTVQSRNIAVLKAHLEDFNRQDPDALARYCSDDFSNHGRRVGQAGARWVLEDIFTRFPDCRQDLLHIVAVDDDVITRTTYSGRHRGVGRRPIDGGFMIGVPPTGRTFSVEHTHWYRMENGLFTHHWANRDDTGMLVQLGLMAPAPVYDPASEMA